MFSVENSNPTKTSAVMSVKVKKRRGRITILSILDKKMKDKSNPSEFLRRRWFIKTVNVVFIM